jgi:hypothetical protein
MALGLMDSDWSTTDKGLRCMGLVTDDFILHALQGWESTER